MCYNKLHFAPYLFIVNCLNVQKKKLVFRYVLNDIFKEKHLIYNPSTNAEIYRYRTIFIWKIEPCKIKQIFA